MPAQSIVRGRRQEGKPPRCPECGAGALSVSPATVSEEIFPGFHVRGRPLPRRERPMLAAFCDRCEFVVEVR